MNARCILAAFLFSAALAPAAANAQTPAAMTLAVDATQAPRNLFKSVVTMPVTPGHCAFAYPKWIPAWETPSGPIENLVNLHVSAGGHAVVWHRDNVDMFKFTCDAGNADSITVSMTIIGTTPDYGYNATLQGTSHVAVLQWSSLLVYPEGENVYQQPISASLQMPAGWNGASALTERSHANGRITFAQTMLNQLVDSPFHMGLYHRQFQLSSGPSPTYLDIVADSAHAMDIPKAELTGMKHLVQEAPAFYGPPHYEHYHFLLTLSDVISGGGFEHHQSSSDQASEDYLDPAVFRLGPDLMSHEYSHSWNGKYRRPAGMFIKNYNEPMKDDLIWVYEGMNEYNGKVLAIRSRLATLDDMRAEFAIIGAWESYRWGRNWRPLIDTAISAPYLYTSDGPYQSLRRSAGDFYDEGMLVWLEADTIIRQQSHGSKTLDDFLHLYTAGGSRTPSVKTYDFEDIVALLNQTVPYDWRGFFEQKIYALQPAAPVAGIERSGWRIVYRDKPTPLMAAQMSQYGMLYLNYSVGMALNKNGRIGDVIPESAAANAGLAPGMSVVAVNGRTYTSDRMETAVADAKRTHKPIAIIATNGSFVRTYDVAYYGGDRYPWLERIAGKPDMLTQIFAPKTFKP